MKFILLRRHWPVLALIAVVVFLWFLNLSAQPWLTGWDNLHTEFNPALYIKRYLNTTWLEYRGLGLVAGMAESADLIRHLLVIPISLIFSPSSVRNILTLICLISGVIGTKQLAYHTLLRKFDLTTRNVGSFFAGLFYLLNLASLQTFYTPFETFTWFYACLPWLVLNTLRYLTNQTRSNYLIFALTLVFSSPAFYVQTLFIVFLVVLLPYLAFYLYGRKKLNLRLALTCIVTLLITQSYWLLPLSYYTFNVAPRNSVSLQNTISNQEMALRNQEFGRLSDVALLKGFNFDYVDLSPDNDFRIMMGPWTDHLENPLIKYIGYLIFTLVVAGIIYSYKNKLLEYKSHLILLIVSIFFLVNRNYITAGFYTFLADYLPFFSQIFRTVYTKWSIPASLSYALFFSVGIVFLIDLFTFLSYRLSLLVTAFTVSLLLIVFSNPAFQGHFIYPAMRQTIPQEYFQLFDFFNSQDENTRIANFPQHTFWGWEYYRWPCPSETSCAGGGYRGSGFLWYGITQPILDRAFDVWSPYSEQYYFDIQKAVYSQDEALFDSLLEKYSVNWILVDESIIAPAQIDQKTLYLPELTRLLENNSKISLVKTFGFLKVYAVNLSTAPRSFISTVRYTPYLYTLPSVPLTGVLIDTPADNHSVLSAPKNCDNFNSTLFDRRLLPGEVRYAAVNASSCDHLLYPYLPHNQAYDIHITHRNYSGLPFLVCLEDYASHQCLINRYLPSSPDWITTTLSLPPMKSGEYGYTLHLFNYSIGRVPVENAWRQIEILPKPGIVTSVSQPDPAYAVAAPSSVVKRNYSLYTLSASAQSSSDRLVLNQAFDIGWKAFVVPADVIRQPSWQIYLDALFMEPLPESSHRRVNDWANSWILPQGENHLILIYYPQYLQFIGFSLLLLLPSLYFLHSKNSR